MKIMKTFWVKFFYYILCFKFHCSKQLVFFFFFNNLIIIMNLIKIDYKRNDTFKNGYDPDDNHTGIHLASVTSDPAASLDNFGIDLKSRRPIQGQIYYENMRKPTSEVDRKTYYHVRNRSKLSICRLKDLLSDP